MQKTIAHITISYFVIIGAELIAFSILEISAPLWQSLTIAAVFTVVSILLGWHQGDNTWTRNESENSSTIETASTAT